MNDSMDPACCTESEIPFTHCPKNEAVVELNDASNTLWGRKDRRWIVKNKKRNYYIREPLPDELSKEDLQVSAMLVHAKHIVAVRQIGRGIRVRYSCSIQLPRDFKLPNDEASSQALWELLNERRNGDSPPWFDTTELNKRTSDLIKRAAMGNAK